MTGQPALHRARSQRHNGGHMDWRTSVAAAIMRQVRRTGSATFARQDLLNRELGTIIEQTSSLGGSPEQTLSRVLQELRDDGQLEFLEPGSYRLIVPEAH